MEKATPNAGFYSILASTIVVIGGLLIEGLASTNPIMYGIATGFVVLIGISLITNYRNKESLVTSLGDTKQG